MTECRDCGLAEDLEWGETKAGKPILMEIRRVPHFAICPAKKNGATARRQPRKSGDSPATEAALEALTGKPPRGLGFKVREAKGMVERVPAAVIDARDVAEIVREALMRNHEA